MALEDIQTFFRSNLLLGGASESIAKNMTVWMPEFVGEVNENTDLMFDTADELNILASHYETKKATLSVIPNDQ